MKNYIIKPGTRGMFDIDVENDVYDVIEYFSTNIDWTYLVPEDGTLTVVLNGENVKKAVKKNDIVMVFYDYDWIKNRVIVIKSKEWKENITAKKKYDEDMRAKRALDEKCNDCADCENCVCKG